MSKLQVSIACTLTSAELQSRGAELLPGLVARAVGRVPVTDGFRWAFAPTFAVAAEPDGGPISLEVTGPPGTPQFLEQLVTGA